jgi:hypothetical protein
MAEPHVRQADFVEQQLAFAAHIRDPQGAAAPPGIEDRRMAIYRELFYNNVENFIRSGFPVLRQLSDDETWHRRIRDFFRDHRCQTPYFVEIAAEFVEWLQNERGDHPDDPPFIQELAHYEWVELALSVSDADRDLPPVDPNGDLMDGRPLLSPVAWPLAYHWPVHQISPEFQPDAPGEQPTYLVVNRDRLDKVHFVEVNAVTYRLLQLLGDEPSPTGREALQIIAEELGHPQPEAVIAHGQTLLEDLKARNIILGTRV